jgi:hypothetical protein
VTFRKTFDLVGRLYYSQGSGKTLNTYLEIDSSCYRSPVGIVMAIRTFVISLSVALVVGCGNPTGRVGLSGSVTFRGKPVDSGTIQFRARAGTGGDAAVAAIVNGRYDIPAAHGVPPGTYEVVISSPDPNPPKIGEGYGLSAERLPAKVNTATTLKVEVTARGPNQFDFPID